MTAIVNQITSRVATANPYDADSVILSAIAVLLLLTCLIIKELARASADRRVALWGRVFNIAIVPLTFAFIYIVFVRFLALLPS